MASIDARMYIVKDQYIDNNPVIYLHHSTEPASVADVLESHRRGPLPLPLMRVLGVHKHRGLGQTQSAHVLLVGCQTLLHGPVGKTESLVKI